MTTITIRTTNETITLGTTGELLLKAALRAYIHEQKQLRVFAKVARAERLLVILEKR